MRYEIVWDKDRLAYVVLDDDGMEAAEFAKQSAAEDWVLGQPEDAA